MRTSQQGACVTEIKPRANTQLKHFRELRGWSQAKLAELLGTTPVSVSRWETGTMVPTPYFREKLCELFQKNADELGLIAATDEADLPGSQEKNAEWIKQESVEHLAPDGENGLWPATIPQEYYYPLPGREAHLNQLLIALRDPQGVPIVVIDGLGGLGKTALATELARRAVRRQHFLGVIGDSAKLEEFTGDGIVTVREATLDFDLLLDALARQLNHWEIPALKPEEKRIILTRLLQQQPYLILVDNLETAENAHALVAKLRSLLGTSRAIITSRKQVRQEYAQHLSLVGLDLADSLLFLEVDMKQRGFQQSLSREQLVEIHEVTGGAPLAMKLVVAQASFLNLDVVLRQLRTTSGEGLYTYIFRRSWEHLLPVAQRILYYIGKTAVAPVDWEELSSVGIAESEAELLKGLTLLVDYSLVEVASSTDGPGYGVHQLTRQFVNGELPKLWREQGLQ